MSETMKVADIKIREGFNARDTNGGIPLEQQEDTITLSKSIKLLGVTNPVTVDSEGYLVAGERRLTAAKLAGLTEVPFTLESGDEKRRLAVHGAENVARKDLSPAEEAGLIERMLAQGYTADGAAEALGMSKARVTRRLVLLELPRELRVFWGPHGEVPLDVASYVAAIVGKLPELASVILHAEQARQAHRPRSQEEIQALRDQAYEEGLEEDAYLEEDELPFDVPGRDAPLALEKLLSEPVRYLNALQRVYTPAQGKRPPKGMPKWPADVIVAIEGVELTERNLEALGVAKTLRDRVSATQDALTRAYVYNTRLRLSEADFDVARAAGVTIVLGQAEVLYDLSWLKARIKSDIVSTFEQDAKLAIEARKQRDTSSSSTTSKKRPDEELSPHERQEKEKRRAEREAGKEWKARAAGANEALGIALLNKLGEVKADPKVIKLFVEASLGRRPAGGGYGDRVQDRPAAKLAAAGLRYVMPDWPTVVSTPTKANPNKTRTDYLEPEEAEKKMWEWFDQAKTVEEILGRGIVIHAAAMWANEHVEPQSRRVSWHAGGTIELPPGPGETLRKLTAGSVPAQVKKLAKDIQDFKP